MSVDKLVDSTQLDNDLTAVANAIRSKRGISNTLLFPSEFVTEINNISSVEKKSGSGVNFNAAEVYTIPQVLIDINPVQSGTGDPAPDNVRPITGWTGVKITQTGKNLLPNLTGPRATGSIFIGQTDDTTYPIHLKANITYTISFQTNLNYAYSYMKEDGGSNIQIGRSESNYTPTHDMNVQMWVYGSGLTTVTDFMLEVGSTATTYEPYTSADMTIDLPTPPGTVYGGTLDLTNMILTVNRVMLNPNQLVRGNVNQNGDGRIFYALRDTTGAVGIGQEFLNNYLAPGGAVASYEALAINTYRTTPNASSIVLCMPGAESTKNDMLTWWASNNIQFSYILATPQTYQLTPEQLSVNYYKQTWTGASGESIQLYDTQARNAFILMTRYTKAETHSATDGLLTNYGTSNIYVSNTTQATSADDNNITIKSTSYDSNYIYLFAPPSVIADVAALRAYLANTPLEIQYPVETPFNYELYEKDHINSLIGVNNIWADTGDVHITVIGGL